MGTPNKLGELLRSARERASLSQSAAARAAGIPQTSLSQAEAGARGLSEEGIVRLSQTIGIPPERALLAAVRDRLARDAPDLADRIGERAPGNVHAVLYAAQAEHADCHVDRIDLDAQVNKDGWLHWTRTVKGLRPNPDGRAVYAATFRDRLPAAANGSGPRWDALPAVEHQVGRRIEGNYLIHEVTFPRGWRACDGGEVSGSLTVDYPPRQPAAVRSSLANRPLHHLARLQINLSASCGWRPHAPEAWAWRGDHGLKHASSNLIDRETCASYLVTATEDGTVLIVDQPLAGYHYALVWPPDGHHHVGGMCSGGKT